MRDDQGRLTHTPEGKPLEVPLSGKVRFRPRVKGLDLGRLQAREMMPPLPLDLTEKELSFLAAIARRQSAAYANRHWLRLLTESQQTGDLEVRQLP